MSAAIDATELLRPGLLDGVSVLLAGAPPSEPGAPEPHGETSHSGEDAPRRPAELGETVASACAALGALVASWEPAGGGGVSTETDVLVVDGAAVFARGSARAAGAARMPRAALDACLDLAWEATHAVVNEAFLPAGRTGRIVYLAPAPHAGRSELARHAEPARAGLENLARTLSIEWARYGITPVTIAPGGDTPSGSVAALVAYLASPAGAYFSGCLLDLRGPLAAGR